MCLGVVLFVCLFMLLRCVNCGLSFVVLFVLGSLVVFALVCCVCWCMCVLLLLCLFVFARVVVFGCALLLLAVFVLLGWGAGFCMSYYVVCLLRAVLLFGEVLFNVRCGN